MKRALIASLMMTAMGLAANCLAAGHSCPNCECSNCKPGIFHRANGWLHAKHNCPDCGKHCGLFHKCGGHLHHGHRMPPTIDYGGPPSAQITYPYYTNRGPRDFLDPNPRGIGP